jgi:hypothetical protein
MPVNLPVLLRKCHLPARWAKEPDDNRPPRCTVYERHDLPPGL